MISHVINTSYKDLMYITPTERKYMLEFINEEANHRKEQAEELDKMREQMLSKKK